MTNTSAVSKIISMEGFRRKNASTPSALSSWKELLKKEIEIIVSEWEGELMVNSTAINSANLFIDNLPYDIKKPSIALENKEAFLFEWSRIENNAINGFSAIVEKDRITYTTYNLEEASRGAINLSAGSISMISSTISKHFANQASHDPQSNRHSI